MYWLQSSIQLLTLTDTEVFEVVPGVWGSMSVADTAKEILYTALLSIRRVLRTRHQRNVRIAAVFH